MEGRRDLFLKKIEAGTEKEPVLGNLSLNLGTREAVNVTTNERVRLGMQEYQILWMFMRGNDILLSEGEILDYLYEDIPDDKDIPLSNIHQVVMRRICEKVARIGITVHFENEHGSGYRLALESPQGQA